MVNETLEQLIERMSGARCHSCMFYEYQNSICRFSPPKRFLFCSFHPEVGAYNYCSNFVKRQKEMDEER